MADENPKILELRERRAKAHKAGGEDRIAKFKAKGKLTARERIEAFLDVGSFNEIETYLGHRSEDLGVGPRLEGDGVITGWGTLNGRTVYVYSQDFTVIGGALGEQHGRKIAHLMDLGAAAGCPVIGMIDSGGARINEGVRSLWGYAQIFRRNTMYSGVIPQISIVMGPCAGGAAYSPVVTDLLIMVEQQGYMFLTGPQVIKSVTGEEIDMESLGGAAVHMGTSGTCHFTAPSDQAALDLAKRILSYLPSNNMENPPFVEPSDDPYRMDDDLNNYVPDDPNAPYDMYYILNKVVDAGSFTELLRTFAQNAIIGLARIGGHAVGVVAQQPMVMAGSMEMNSGDKIARFVRFCDAFNIPILTLVDVPGFLPGTVQEWGGIIRNGAKLLFAFAEATVPKVTVILRKAYGGAYCVMSSKHLRGDVNYAWPTAEIAVMGAKGATEILYRSELGDTEKIAERTREYETRFANPFVAAERGFIDEVIMPHSSRKRIARAFAALRTKSGESRWKKHDTMPL